MSHFMLNFLTALVAAALFSVTAGAEPDWAPSAPPAKPLVVPVPGTRSSFEMVAIPGGTFTMGSPAGEEGRKPDEDPQVAVEVEPFYMGKYEVTWAEYEQFLKGYADTIERDQNKPIPPQRRADAVTYPTPIYELEVGPILQRMGRGGRFPAVAMSQFDARQYTKWLSKKTGRFFRLPTEAEWEYACRAGTTTAFSFGDDPKKLKDYAWYFDNSGKGDGDGAYREVGTKKPNPWGLYDMHGNVAEWCIDQYDARRYAELIGFGRVAAAEIVHWPNKKHPRVIRGGSYYDEAERCRSAARVGSTKADVDMHNFHDFPESPHWSSSGFWIGFRVVSPAAEPTEAEKLRYWNADDVVTLKMLRTGRYVHEVIEPPTAPAGR
jgi:formylglycine-generating enzyme